MAAVTKARLVKALDRKIGGNEAYKEDLAVLGYLYYRKLIRMSQGVEENELPKLNMFITGESGSGKTFGVQVLAETLDLPFYRVNITDVVAHGWQGVDLAEHVSIFLDRTPKEFEGAGILFIDEIDKLGAPAIPTIGNSNISDGKLALQANLLDLLDGVFNGRVEGRHRYDLSAVNNSLLIMGGSFQGIRDVLANKGGETTRSIGFGNTETKPLLTIDNEITKRFSKKPLFDDKWREDLIALKVLPELCNRVVAFTQTEKVDREGIKDILVNKKNNSLAKYQKLMPRKKSYDIEALVDGIVKSDAGIRVADSLIYEQLKRSLK